mgnify:CR=1|jgi:hypothetical protein|tara:strand:+ start:4479 stop:4673 length:195 start_codon:yes stop_codon:yes gene_type:complete
MKIMIRKRYKTLKNNVIQFDPIKKRKKELEDAKIYTSCMKWLGGIYNRCIYWGVKSGKKDKRDD